MAQEPQKNEWPDTATDAFTPVSARTRPPALPRSLLLALAVAGLIGGALVALRYAVPTPTDPKVTLPVAGRLLRMALPPQDEAGIVFGPTDTKPGVTADLLPAGVPIIYAWYEAPGRQSAGPPQAKWTRDGKPLPAPRAAEISAEPGKNAGKILLRAPGGSLSPGVYELELKLGPSNLAASFVAAWGAEAIAAQSAPADAQVTITDLALATAVSALHQPQHPRKSFQGSDRIFAAFKFARAEPGSAIVVKWFGGPELIKSATKEIVLPGAAGSASGWLQAPLSSPLPAGEYSVSLSMAGDTALLATAAFTVMPFSSASGLSPHKAKGRSR